MRALSKHLDIFHLMTKYCATFSCSGCSSTRILDYMHPFDLTKWVTFRVFFDFSFDCLQNTKEQLRYRLRLSLYSCVIFIWLGIVLSIINAYHTDSALLLEHTQYYGLKIAHQHLPKCTSLNIYSTDPIQLLSCSQGPPHSQVLLSVK